MSETPEQQPDEPAQEISLDELSQAYAQVIDGESALGSQVDTESLRLAKTTVDRSESPDDQPDDSPTEQPTDQGEPQPQEAEPDEADVETAEDENEDENEEEEHYEISPRTILEAMLFVGNQESQPLSATKAAELMRGVGPREVTELIDELNRRYTDNNCPYEIVSEGAGYRLVLRKVYHSLRNRFYGRVREARLSQAAVDALAVVAYQQPLTADQISRLRDKPSGNVLSQLVRRGLLRIERKKVEGKKRPVAHYFTTERFLEVFGLSGLEDLPQTG